MTVEGRSTLLGKTVLVGPLPLGDRAVFATHSPDGPLYVPFGHGDEIPDRTVDALMLVLGEAPIPPAAWSVRAPRVGLVRDCAEWHRVRRAAAWCDIIVPEAGAVEALRRSTATAVATVPGAELFAIPRPPIARAGPRDIDVVAVGFEAAVLSRSAAAAAAELIRLRRTYDVRFAAPTDDLFGRSRLAVFAGSGLAIRRSELAAAGAGCLVIREVGAGGWAPFREGTDAVGYTHETFGRNVRVGLTSDGERERVAAAGRALAAGWDAGAAVLAVERHVADRWEELVERFHARSDKGETDPAMTAREYLGGFRPPAGVAAALEAIAGPPQADITAVLMLGALTANAAALRRAVGELPGKVAPGALLATTLATSGQREEATDVARRAVAVLGRLGALAAIDRDPPWPGPSDEFRTRWERAGLEAAGNSAAESAEKHALLRWRLHALLGELTGDLAHHYEAHLACPASASARAALGAALLRAGRPVEAATHLRVAVAVHPLSAAAGRACFEALAAAGAVDDQRALAHDYRLLSAAAPGLVPPEPWFADAAPPEDDLASVIVLCHNQAAYTRACLESVLRNTRRPFELVLVDNGSTDDTSAYMDDVRTRPEPARVVVIRNATNRGYPAGVNQGLAAARGGHLVLLNNDTVLPEGWLDGLIAHLGAPGERPVGLVGPMSNYAAAPQHTPAEYAHLGGLEQFAAAIRREHTGEGLAVRRLTGFCLLVRRAVFAAIGGLDERFGLGFFDDDDLCLRAIDAGFRLVVARDVFVHHFGSRTFRGLGLDVRECLRANFDVFRDKWGAERVAGYRPPEPTETKPLLPAGERPAAPTRPTVSLTMIVRNEEGNIGQCLATVADLVDEVIVVDTGSSDRTKAVAAEHGARVHDFPWVDSFAAARNEALRHATGQWVLWLDADDRLDEENRGRLREVFAGLGAENAAYVMKVRSATGRGGGTTRLLDQVRLFRNHPYIRWRYRVHEQILPAVGQSGGRTRWTDVVITHTGYVDPALRRRKLERNTRLLEIEYAEQPDDPFTLFNLGRSYLDLDRVGDALPVLRASLSRSDPALSIVRKLHPLITQAHWLQGDRAAAEAACDEGLGRFPEDAELLYQKALLRREADDLVGAEDALLRLLRSKPGEYFDMLEAGLRGFKARHLLGAVYRDLKRDADAEGQYRAAVQEQPDFVPAALSLCDLLVTRKAFDEADRMALALARDPATAADAAVMSGRVALGRKRYREARAVVEAAAADHPGHLPLRVLLTHVLIEEGADWAAAEQALRAVLALDPEHKEAAHNLAVLLKQHRSLAD